MPAPFTLESIEDLTGKTVVVTGATMGLGFQSAVVFASKGARVLLHGRTLEKATAAAEAVKDKTGSELVVPIFGELSSLEAVKRLGMGIAKHTKEIDILMLNAGLGGIDYQLSDDGIEMTMAVNHMAHFYLVKRLDHIIRASKTRIVSVSSSAVGAAPKEGVRATLEEWNDKENYNSLRSYAASKIANVLFTQSLAAKYGDSGVIATVVDPGVVSTGFQAKATGGGLFGFVLRNLAWLFASSPEAGVITQVFASVSPKVTNGSAWCLVNTPWNVSAITVDDRAERLWKLSESILKKKGF
ncbi:hypothetical protein BC831DRAFT_449465, partial [Entophlyctis helioformis]